LLLGRSLSPTITTEVVVPEYAMYGADRADIDSLLQQGVINLYGRLVIIFVAIENF